MNVNLLIDAIVRQTMVLIAQLATTSGGRTPLAHLANQVFLDLVGTLTSQGVGRRVIADMFGVSMSTYYAKVKRLSESATDRGRSLWEVVYDYLKKHGTTRRIEVLERFRYDDEAMVTGVLADLVRTGLVFTSGRGASRSYRVTDEADLTRSGSPKESAAALVCVTIYSEGPLERQALLDRIPLPASQIDEALRTLLADRRIEQQSDGSSVTYLCQECVIPVGAELGFEAAIFDHYQAMVSSIAGKLEGGQARALPGDSVGGCTYRFDVWPNHPQESEVIGLLGRFRKELSELRTRVEATNERAGGVPAGHTRVIFYAGQNTVYEGDDLAEEGDA